MYVEYNFLFSALPQNKAIKLGVFNLIITSRDDSYKVNTILETKLNPCQKKATKLNHQLFGQILSIYD